MSDYGLTLLLRLPLLPSQWAAYNMESRLILTKTNRPSRDAWPNDIIRMVDEDSTKYRYCKIELFSFLLQAYFNLLQRSFK